MADDRSRHGDASQAERFKEAARDLGCDDSEEAFDEALKKVARHTPKDERAKPPSKPAKDKDRKNGD